MDKTTERIFLNSLGWQTSLDVELPAPVGCQPMPPVTAEIETADTSDLVDPGYACEANGELPKRQGWHGKWEPGGGTWTPPNTTDELKDLLNSLKRWNPEGD